MEETLKMMKTVILGYEKDTAIEDLLNVYKEKQNPNILAYLFVSNYGLIVQTGKLFPLLDEQDISSFSLQELDKAILNYDFNKQCKFVTFFNSCLKNRLRSENESLYSHLRLANYNTVDIQQCYDIASDYDLFSEIDDYSSNLTKEEKQQCNLILNGYNVKEIASMLQLSTTSIYERNKKIGKKLLESL